LLEPPVRVTSAPKTSGPALTDSDAKKPGAAANVREAAVPKAPVADSSDKRTK
jgi:NADH-quinone oxidoreductase subunit E